LKIILFSMMNDSIIYILPSKFDLYYLNKLILPDSKKKI